VTREVDSDSYNMRWAFSMELFKLLASDNVSTRVMNAYRVVTRAVVPANGE
jgi:hypothetical protein